MILGLGTDVIEISRMEAAIKSERFRKRVFTEAEIIYCQQRGRGEAASYAARFAAKEAVLKAFGTGLRQGSLTEIEVSNDALGCPRIRLYGRFAVFAQKRGINKIFLSLSHAKEYAVAQCIVGRNGE